MAGEGSSRLPAPVLVYNPSSAGKLQRPHRVEERAAAARGEGRHVDDAGGDEEPVTNFRKA